MFQDDIVEATLTVLQTLDFAARLRLPSQSLVKERVSKVAGLIGLGEFLGSTVASLSGGERKRVCIATEVNRQEEDLSEADNLKFRN